MRAARSGSLATQPVDDRPRERLLRSGSRALSDAELIAVLLRVGRRGQSAIEMAHELLDELGGLVGLLHVPAKRLRRKGLGDAKAATVLAAFELGRRLARAQLPDRRLVDQPAAVARYLSLRYGVGGQEIMGALFLDVRNRMIDEREIFRGTLCRTAVEPRAILKEAIALDAAALLIFHTHPSGDPTPSAEDIAFTRRLAAAGQIVGVELTDHLVLGSAGHWVSLRRRLRW